MTDVQANVRNAMSKPEFIALIAMMFATIAFSIDAMLPALPEIGAELSPDDLNKAQLILTSFVLGMGIGTFFTGPLSDAFGRKPVIFGGAVIYIAACAVAWQSRSLELVLAARVVQGIAVAAPRIVGLAIVRDLFAGREMAKIMSFAMMVFTIFPAFAPLIGSGIIGVIGWRGIFLAFILFSLISVLWLAMRLPETLPTEDRRAFRLPLLMDALRQLFANTTVRISIGVQTLCLAILFTMLSMVQPVYDVIFDEGDSFAKWFFLVALISGTASILNAALVGRVGMRRMISWSLGLQTLVSLAVLCVGFVMDASPVYFAVFIAYQTGVFFMAGTTMGNINAIAMEPMGHIAGMAASVMGAISTVGAAIIGATIGQFFNATIIPLAGGITVMAFLAFLLMLYMDRIEKRGVI
ncbi:MAG: multidrug effflux MFS transporter [Paracoccaceae bacterium]